MPDQSGPDPDGDFNGDAASFSFKMVKMLYSWVMDDSHKVIDNRTRWPKPPPRNPFQLDIKPEFHVGCQAYLRTWQNLYVTAEPDGRVTCNRHIANGWELFDIMPVDSGRIRIGTIHNKVVVAGELGVLRQTDTADHSDATEFEVVKAFDDNNVKKAKDIRIGLRAVTGSFVSAHDDKLAADRSEMHEWETFEFYAVPNKFPPV